MFTAGGTAAAAFSRSRRFFSTSKFHDAFGSAIAEMNKEMEVVFGEVPPSGLAGSVSTNPLVEEQQPQLKSQELPLSFTDSNTAQELSRHKFSHIPDGGDNNLSGLTHVGSRGEAQMVDVSAKDSTKRVAIASCKVVLGEKVFDMVSANQMAKGDVLTVAKIAGINGAKQTSTLIPLCHNIALSHLRVDLVLNPEDHSVEIKGEAATTGKTGVEMEALTAVATAGLTVYDMCKAASKDIRITDVQLEGKTGGKSGDWSRGKV
ncbi:unnamed protein product [Linum trigynum]|uniref:cyclic pyranopterin monophosphate synthase n=1 Tax=Linum trigynum TaxID=586398 RepID=A0AAV2D6G1_9ROSI